MGKGAEPADTKGAANVEGQYGRQAARDEAYANRPDQYNAFGNLTWQRENVRDPSTGEMTTKWTQRENLSPNMKFIFDRQMQGLKERSAVAGKMGNRALAGMAQNPDWNQFGQMQRGAQAGGMLGGGVLPTTGTGGFKWGSPNRRRAEEASYGWATSRLDPQWQKAAQAHEVSLRNKGLRPGDQAYAASMQDFNQGRNDAYSTARQDSVGQGRMEDQQSFGQAQNAFGLNMGQQQQAYGQRIGAAENIRAADQQRFGQEQQASDQANALREAQIQEYVKKRQFAFNEQQLINPTRDAQELSQTFGSQGGK